MRKSLLIGGLVLANIMFAQSVCSHLETELKKSKLEIEELSKQVAYYKETLNLLKPIAQASANNLEFTITNATGNKVNKTLVITYLYRNTSDTVRKYYQGMSSYIVDDRGNQNNTYEVLANKERSRVESIQPDIPMKGFIKFKINEIDFSYYKTFKC